MTPLVREVVIATAAVAVPLAVVAVLVIEGRRRQRRLAALGDLSLISRLLPADAMRSRGARALRLAVAAALAGAAFWGPRWGTERRVRETEGADVVIAVDVSLSMLAADEKPTRLDRVRQEIRKLRGSSRANRLGLVAFAGRSYVLAPLTTDAGSLELFLDNLGPDLVGQPGSAIGPAIRQGTDLLTASRSAADRALVVMTDGESFEPPDAIVAAARYARDGEVRLIAMGFGTEAGSTIAEQTERGREWHRDRDGVVVVTRAHPEVLETIARESGGVAILPSTLDRTGALRGALDDLKTAMRTETGRNEQRSRYQWFLLPALLLLFWDAAGVSLRRRRRSEPASSSTSTLAATLTALLILVALPHTARAADPPTAAFRAGRYAEAAQDWRARINAGDDRPATRFNLGTALLFAGSLDSAIAVLDPLARLATGDLRTRTLYNLGLAHLRRARAPRGDPNSFALAADCYRRVLLAAPADQDAKFNYELAHKRKDGGGGSANQPPPPEPKPGEEAQAPPRDGSGLDRRQAEQLLDNAARDERDAQKKKSRKSRGEPPRVEKDW